MQPGVCVLWETDLFRPHNDPDDHYDLAALFTLAGLGRLRPRGILIDFSPPGMGGPDLGAIGQLGRITGLYPPVLTGSRMRLRSRHDAGRDWGADDLRAAEWIAELLRCSDRPVALLVAGSSTDIALAGNRYPALFREKCAGVYLNAGAAFRLPGGRLEYNVELNPHAFATLFDLPCPVFWFPCFQGITAEWELLPGEYGTFYQAEQSRLFEGLPPSVLRYFLYMLTRSEDPRWLQYLDRETDEAALKRFRAQPRSLWCTASLLAAAGMGVRPDGSRTGLQDPESVFELLPAAIRCGDDGAADWRLDPEGPHRIFHIRNESAYSSAMTAALAGLLRLLAEEGKGDDVRDAP